MHTFVRMVFCVVHAHTGSMILHSYRKMAALIDTKQEAINYIIRYAVCHVDKK